MDGWKGEEGMMEVEREREKEEESDEGYWVESQVLDSKAESEGG